MIKKFENFEHNNTKDYFKDKVNWKSFNYIRDVLLDYEDKGEYTNIYVKVCCYNGDGFYYDIYFKTNNSNLWLNPLNMEIYIDCYEKYGLFYKIGLPESFELPDITSEELSKKFENKYIILLADNFYNHIVIKDK